MSASEIQENPVLAHIAAHGAVLYDLGQAHGLETIFARSGTLFQVFYLAPDRQAIIGGVMWSASGHDVTRDQVAPIPGAIPTVTIAQPDRIDTSTQVASAAPLSGSAALDIVKDTKFGTIGDSKAPRLWMFIDPYCAFSVRAEQQLRSYVAAGRIQLAVIPVSVLDYEDQNRSTPAAQIMAALPGDQMVVAWTSQKLAGTPPAGGTAALKVNDAARAAIGLKGTPTFLWQRADGSVDRSDGIPANLDAMVASVGH